MNDEERRIMFSLLHDIERQLAANQREVMHQLNAMTMRIDGMTMRLDQLTCLVCQLAPANLADGDEGNQTRKTRSYLQSPVDPDSTH